MEERKVKDYVIVYGVDHKQLQERIAENLKDGWQLWKGLVIDHVQEGDVGDFYQAMVKYEEEDKTDGA